jgi:hypothetical protein
MPPHHFADETASLAIESHRINQAIPRKALNHLNSSQVSINFVGVQSDNCTTII